jgi:hypothetical protein
MYKFLWGLTYFWVPLYIRLTWIHSGTSVLALKLSVYTLHTDGVTEGNFSSTGRNWLSRQVSPDNLNRSRQFEPAFVFVRPSRNHSTITFIGTLSHQLTERRNLNLTFSFLKPWSNESFSHHQERWLSRLRFLLIFGRRPNWILAETPSHLTKIFVEFLTPFRRILRYLNKLDNSRFVPRFFHSLFTFVQSFECLKGRPRPALAPRPSVIYRAFFSISVLRQSYISNEV